ncbi:DUF6446 family protein [Histidinibacterium aquaticum]|uniref:Histidine kinase n=1 Tax=Histidinibacterium aquaticum TaxID=2613962 RepID=A0A5J5GP77_9RHOB|nr:DUF6446 family protein [Histidinibacterium aquaticum]KAA9010139.1 histidine kinase [Histidinibacterium aquaticum]
MSAGRIAILGILVTALVAGIALYYLQVFAYYEEIPPEEAKVQLVNLSTGEPEDVRVENFQGIDSGSSPIRYRACFDMGLSVPTLTETYEIYEEAVPLVAPGWFDCFDADEIGAALEDQAIAFLGEENIEYGVDRVVAVMPDGRAYAWNQLNRCGEVVFDGDPAPEGCPPAPEGYR